MRLLTIVLLIVLVTGCSTYKGGSGAPGIWNDLQVDVWASKTCITSPGETVKVTATVTNRGKQNVSIGLKDKPVLDIKIDYAVTNQERRVVRWSDGKEITPEITTLALTPGASKSIEMDWNSMRPYGDIANVRAELNHDDSSGPTVAYLGVFVGSCPGIGP